MMYEAKTTVCKKSVQNTQRKASAMYIFEC